ncbi:type II toxin-antitoxin system PemK/MazF family toxin [Halonotius terrestris]|uniref:Type II toxin-antitoxin system PemK/MazF family toxin n=1 Tax=Halonotius terrestris TaxID=2487750 RepID=A0A8J8P8S7_9EURY|nr:type II toxin-antitoxin system PemK/MazF family toxin [Halonotius terrestris]TQQ81109.1 type II toxin-antitoxin system PemK/MazF family toxin [Halonotius terrestris]
MSVEVRRGDIVTVQLNPTRGSEQQGTNRPCIVIQNDVGNEFSPTTMVAPLTTQYDPSDIYPFEVEIQASNTALREDSVVDLSQIRVVDIDERVTDNIGTVPPVKMSQIDTAIKDSLGL